MMQDPARSIPWRPVALDRFIFGVCHFPEQERPEHLHADAKRMAEAGVEVARMGEFAWSIFEPEEGRYDFALFDSAIEALADCGIRTVLCTPTATPPRWLTRRHPEVLRVDADGRLQRHGSRQHVDLTSPLFREYSRGITRTLASHYRDNPNVIGWQTDNELNTHFSETHSEAAQVAFRKWVKAQYGDIEALNAAWGTVFWSRQYACFDEIETPIDSRPASADPSHMLDYRRFLADETREFQVEQVRILRDANPLWFVFHNIGRLNDTDLRQFSLDLDFLGTDLYPGLRDEYMMAGLGYAQAMQLDSFRGWGGNFIVPEMQVGGGAHPGFAIPNPEPGELKRFAYSAVARGADGIFWFRWTSARYGAEAYWAGVIDHDRIPRRRFAELKDTITSLKMLEPDLIGTTVHTDVAILASDWDSEIAHATFSLGLPSLLELALPLHHHCYTRNIACGFASPADDLSGVKLAYVPHLPIWQDCWTENLTSFVRRGGVLVIGARTATRTINNHVLEVPAPGELQALSGVAIDEFGRIPSPGAPSVLRGKVFQVEATSRGRAAESGRRTYSMDLAGNKIDAAYGYELLVPEPGTEVLASWSSRFLTGRPAICCRQLGEGKVIYLGTYLTKDLVAGLFEPLFSEIGIVPPVLPAGIESSKRVGHDRSLQFFLNTTNETKRIHSADGSIELPPFGCRVVKKLSGEISTGS